MMPKPRANYLLLVAVTSLACGMKTNMASAITPIYMVPGDSTRCLGMDREEEIRIAEFRRVMAGTSFQSDSARISYKLPARPDTAISVVRDSVRCERAFQTLHAFLDTLGGPPPKIVLYRIGPQYRAISRDEPGHHRPNYIMDSTFRYTGLINW